MTTAALRLLSRSALLLTLLSLSAYLLVHTHLAGDEQVWREGAVNEVVGRGPVTIDHVSWKLDLLRVHTALVDEDRKPIALDVPAGAVIVVAKLSVTPLDGLKMDDGFPCSALLRDDRGNTWKGQSAYGLELPTYCSDDDHPMGRNQTSPLAQVYVVPRTAVPHLVGVTVETQNEFRRVLLTW